MTEKLILSAEEWGRMVRDKIKDKLIEETGLSINEIIEEIKKLPPETEFNLGIQLKDNPGVPEGWMDKWKDEE